MVFPLEVLPVAKIGDATFHVTVSLSLILVGIAAGHSNSGLSWSVLWLPVLVLPLLLMALGMAWALSAIGVFVRDVSQLIAFASTAVMFGSGVMFSARQIPAAIYAFLRFNPLLQLFDLSRHVIFGHEAMNWAKLGYVYGCALAVLLAGHVFFGLLRRSFAEVI